MRISVFAGLVLVVFALLSITSVWQVPVETATSTTVPEAAPTTTPSTTISEAPSTTVSPQTDIDRVIRLPADRYPTHAAFAEDLIWVIAQTHPPLSGERPSTNAFLMGINAATGVVEVEVSLEEAPSRVAADSQGVWVAHWETGSVSRLDPNTGEVAATIALELSFDYGGKGDDFSFIPFDIVMGHDSVWVSTARGAVARIDLQSSALVEMYEFESVPIGADLAVGPDGVWVTGDAGGLYHLSSSTGELTHLSLETLDHEAAGVFVPGGEMGDTVYVTGDRLERSESGEFRISDGSYIASGESAVSAIDAHSGEVLGAAEFEGYVQLAWVNGFVGALDQSGVFTHLSAIPRLGSQINHTTWGGGELFESFRDAWEVDSHGRRLIRVDETGAAAVELPFEVDDSAGGRRPVPDELIISDDWEKRDSPPISQRWPGVVASTGEEIVIWGGERSGGDSPISGGAAYDMEAGTWRTLSDSPLRGPAREPGWVWTGDELIVWTGVNDAAAWQPQSNTWRTIEEWPLGASFYSRARWTGSEILSTKGIAVDPVNGQSRPIADPPAFHERASVVWVDGHLVSVTGEASYRADHDRWIEMPESPLTPLSAAGVAVGDKMVAVDYDMNAAEFEPSSNMWVDLPDLPLRFFECSPDIGSLRGQPVVDHCAGIAIWDGSDLSWVPVTHPVPGSPFSPTVIAAGDRLFAWGDDFYEFVGDPTRPRRLAVGTSILDLPEEWALAGVRGEDGWWVEVVLDSPDGSCVVNALHTSAEGTLQSYITGDPATKLITPYVGGDPVDALVIEPGEIDERHHLVWATGTTDVIDAACDTRSALEQLAPRIWSPYQ